MPTRLSITDLRKRIDWILGKNAAATGALGAPVDLASVCQQLGVGVEWRCMIPEGVTAIASGQLQIFLQSNFRGDTRLRRRQRFTWAHEICHALFYEGLPGNPHLLKGTPSGAALEKACQQGAGYLLVPTTPLLKRTGQEKPISSAAEITALCDVFDVSADVLIRRVHETPGALRDDRAILLLRDRKGELRIEAAAYGALLRGHFESFHPGDGFERWARPILREAVQTEEGAWSKVIEDQELNIRRSKRSSKSEFVELCLKSTRPELQESIAD